MKVKMKTTREKKTDLKKELVKKLLAEGVQVTMSVAKALDEFIDVDVADKTEHLLEKEKETLLERVEGIMKESIGIEKLKDPTDLKKRIQRFAYRCVKNYQKHQRQALSIIREEKTK